jgi:hypothetical protein
MYHYAVISPYIIIIIINDYIAITIYNHIFIYDITRNQKQVAEAVEDMRAQGASVLKQGAVFW